MAEASIIIRTRLADDLGFVYEEDIVDERDFGDPEEMRIAAGRLSKHLKTLAPHNGPYGAPKDA